MVSLTSTGSSLNPKIFQRSRSHAAFRYLDVSAVVLYYFLSIYLTSLGARDKVLYASSEVDGNKGGGRQRLCLIPGESPSADYQYLFLDIE